MRSSILYRPAGKTFAAGRRNTSRQARNLSNTARWRRNRFTPPRENTLSYRHTKPCRIPNLPSDPCAALGRANRAGTWLHFFTLIGTTRSHPSSFLGDRPVRHISHFRRALLATHRPILRSWARRIVCVLLGFNTVPHKQR